MRSGAFDSPILEEHAPADCYYRRPCPQKALSDPYAADPRINGSSSGDPLIAWIPEDRIGLTVRRRGVRRGRDARPHTATDAAREDGLYSGLWLHRASPCPVLSARIHRCADRESLAGVAREGGQGVAAAGGRLGPRPRQRSARHDDPRKNDRGLYPRTGSGPAHSTRCSARAPPRARAQLKRRLVSSSPAVTSDSTASAARSTRAAASSSGANGASTKSATLRGSPRSGRPTPTRRRRKSGLPSRPAIERRPL